VLPLTRYLVLLLPLSVCAATDDLLFNLGLRQGGAVAGYSANAADFDGASYIRSTSGNLDADSKQGIFSTFARFDGSDGVQKALVHYSQSGGTNVRFIIERTAGNVLRIVGRNASGTDILDISTVATITADATWHHVACSWDLADTAKRHCYIDGSSSLSVTTYTDDTIDYAHSAGSHRKTIGGNSGTTPGALMNGCLSELFFDNIYFDLSAAGNLEKFRSASGKPVNLGSDGSIPTGSQPTLYFRTAVPDWETNSGTSSGPWSESGTLTICSSLP